MRTATLTHFRLRCRNTLTNGAGLSARVGLQRQQAGLHLSTRCSLSQYSLITTVATEQAESGWLQSLYAVGQQADQLVQHQLAGAPRPLSALVPQLCSLNTQEASGYLSACRCDVKHICCCIGSRSAHKFVPMHSQCVALDHWLHWWLLS